MKAKDMVRKVSNPDFAGKHLVGSIVFTEEEFAILWSQLCKEQRELCRKEFNHLGTYHGTVVWDKIENTPEPEFE